VTLTADFVRWTPYDSQGVEISIANKALNTAPGSLPDAPRLIDLKEVATLFCFYHRADRTEALPMIMERLRGLGCDHFLAVELDQSRVTPSERAGIGDRVPEVPDGQGRPVAVGTNAVRSKGCGRLAAAPTGTRVIRSA
jgi:hypothetical protein